METTIILGFLGFPTVRGITLRAPLTRIRVFGGVFIEVQLSMETTNPDSTAQLLLYASLSFGQHEFHGALATAAWLLVRMRESHARLHLESDAS